MNPNSPTQSTPVPAQPASTPSFDFGSLGGLLDNTPATPPVVETAPVSLSFGADDFVVTTAPQHTVIQIPVVPEIQAPVMQTPVPEIQIQTTPEAEIPTQFTNPSSIPSFVKEG
jgi:hypothetical protein